MQAQSKYFSKMVDEAVALAAVSLRFLIFAYRLKSDGKGVPGSQSVELGQRQRQGDFHNLVRELQLGDKEFYFHAILLFSLSLKSVNLFVQYRIHHDDSCLKWKMPSCFHLH